MTGNDMRYSDMHTHGDYSDGSGTFKKFMESAREKEIVSLGFSDHSPVPIENGWSMKKEFLTDYFDDLEGGLPISKIYEWQQFGPGYIIDDPAILIGEDINAGRRIQRGGGVDQRQKIYDCLLARQSGSQEHSRSFRQRPIQFTED
mgnify:CR=1 FL=1